MTVEDAFSLLEDHIYTRLAGKKASNGWYNIRGDSFCSNCASHKRSALYILAKEGASPALNCFRAGCGERKIMSVSDFYKIGFDNTEAIQVILKDAAKVSKGSINKVNHSTLIRNIELSQYQKNTLRSRCRFSNDELRDAVGYYRLIPNLYKLICDNYNDSNIINRFNYVKTVSNNGDVVVFATDDHNTFTIRSETLKGMISITESTFSGYTLRSKDCKCVENIVITEGIFDLLNIKRFYGNVDDGLYIATLGFANMFNLIKRYYCRHINTAKTLIIFADSDINRGTSFSYDKRQYSKLLNKIELELGDQAFREIYLVYNKASKDFGDFNKPIEPVKIKIK